MARQLLHTIHRQSQHTPSDIYDEESTSSREGLRRYTEFSSNIDDRNDLSSKTHDAFDVIRRLWYLGDRKGLDDLLNPHQIDGVLIWPHAEGTELNERMGMSRFFHGASVVTGRNSGSAGSRLSRA